MFRKTTEQIIETEPNVENYGNALTTSLASQKCNSTLTIIYCNTLSENNEL